MCTNIWYINSQKRLREQLAKAEKALKAVEAASMLLKAGGGGGEANALSQAAQEAIEMMRRKLEDCDGFNWRDVLLIVTYVVLTVIMITYYCVKTRCCQVDLSESGRSNIANLRTHRMLHSICEVSE